MTEIAKRYGGSLYDLAAEESLTERILEELLLAEECCRREPSYLRLLATPSIPKKERCNLLDQAFAGLHPYVVNFLKILCEEGILGELSGCVRAYRERYNADHGILEVTATTAVPLSASAKEELVSRLQARTGKSVCLMEKIDPSVLGGLRLDLDGTRMDGTVQRRLELLRAEIANVVL